jgi:hypothetical protein
VELKGWHCQKAVDVHRISPGVPDYAFGLVPGIRERGRPYGLGGLVFEFADDLATEFALDESHAGELGRYRR